MERPFTTFGNTVWLDFAATAISGRDGCGDGSAEARDIHDLGFA